MTHCIAPDCRRTRVPGFNFCASHLLAPAGRRGGWLSAHKRKLTMAEADQALDADMVTPRLWVGGKPPADRKLEKFTLIALCAVEIQPRSPAFTGRVIRPRLDDHRLTPAETARALASGRIVARELARGGTCLVTCAMGWNRSALVAGIALLTATRMTADQVVHAIRKARGSDALCNPHFVDMLGEVAARRAR